MEIDELLDKLNIHKNYIENDNGSYSIDLDDSNEFAKYYSRLDNSDELYEDINELQGDTQFIQYLTNDDSFTITLIGDLENDTYKIEIRNLK